MDTLSETESTEIPEIGTLSETENPNLIPYFETEMQIW